MNEFELIRRCFTRPSTAPWCVLGIGDDAAVLQLPADQQLVMCTDTLVAGRHFPIDTPADAIGWKALAVNLSDLAAMGAQPLGFLLNLTLPQADDGFVEEFARGLFELADQHAVHLIGGDTTRGPLSISITAFGSVPPGLALRRDGAQVGDLIAIVGDVGGAALALQQGSAANAALRRKLDKPIPQIAAGLALRGRAHSAIDVSDGLAADLSHILTASHLGAVLDLEKLPLHAQLRILSIEQARTLALHGGDDYALCVSLSPAQFEMLSATSELELSVIGRVIEGQGLYTQDANAKLVPLPIHGYQHF